MTDKQIIIDDQKKTIHRLQQECTEKTNTILALGDKLKCKEQECEQQSWEIGNLGYKIKNQRHEINNRLKQLNQLKSDNDSLKSELMQTNCYLEADKETIDQLKADNDELKNTVMQKCPQCGEIYLNPIGAKLYEALVEIKEIANPYNDMSGNCVIVNCFEDMYKILQKIKEVMPDEN